MDLQISSFKAKVSGHIQITGSKSESNRLLVLRELFPKVNLENISKADDSLVLQKAIQTSQGVVDVNNAGTAMRFGTAFFASRPGTNILLKGSDQINNRPISGLVDALRSLGASISYTQKQGYPPLQIEGRILKKNQVSIDSTTSSQYITALLLISSKLPNGLTIYLKGDKVVSKPYISMTLAFLKGLGVVYTWEKNTIRVYPLLTSEYKRFFIESDWTSVSYYYSLVALSDNGEVSLSSFNENSLQGDSVLVEIYKNLGVQTTFENKKIILKKIDNFDIKARDLDLVDTPDIAQTIAVTCFGLGLSCNLKGLHTLKIKETNRLIALKNEIEKLGGKVRITKDKLTLEASRNIKSEVVIDTYNDHRMAMSFAPLLLKTRLIIKDARVVSKSYPSFWQDISKVVKGINLTCQQ